MLHNVLLSRINSRLAPAIPADDQEFIRNSMAQSNIQRLRQGAMLLIVYMIALLAYDLNSSLMGHESSFWALMLVVSMRGIAMIGAVAIILFLKPPRPGEQVGRLVPGLVTLSQSIFLLLLVTWLWLLSPFRSATFSGFQTAVFVLCAFMRQPPSATALIFLPSWMLYSAFTIVNYYHKPGDLLPHMTNGVILITAVILVSASLFNSRVRRLLSISELAAKKQELQRVNERLAQANKDLKAQASMDELTRIPNRRCFDRVLAREWARCRRSTTPISLLIADVDSFKKYNDFYGHKAGDDCLRQVASAMERTLRRSSDFISRYGGEEFAVILPATDLAGAGCVAENLRRAVEACNIMHRGNAGGRVTISLGLATVVPSSSDEMTRLFNDADKALYRAKNLGRNQWAA